MAPGLLCQSFVNRNQCVRRRRSGGFTLIELLVVLAVLAIAMGLGIPALQNFIIRSKTEGFAREASTLFQRTRLEAIKMNREGAVFLDTATGELVSFIDADRDHVYNPGGGTYRTVDYELGRMLPPSNVQFQDENGNLGVDSIDGFTDIDGEPWLLFQPDGSVLDPGAFRLTDARGNTVEVRVAPAATGRVELRKWQDGEWLGSGDPANPGYKPWKWN